MHDMAANALAPDAAKNVLPKDMGARMLSHRSSLLQYKPPKAVGIRE